VISSVPEISPVLEVVENLLLFGVDGWREGLDGVVDRDGRRAQRAELADHVADGQAGAVLGLAGDGQGGEHDGQVRLDRVALAGEHGPGGQVGLAHPEGLLHVPEIVVAADDLGRGHDGDGKVRDVALQAGQLPRAGEGLLVQGRGPAGVLPDGTSSRTGSRRTAN
jgi:hypothetical protein